MRVRDVAVTGAALVAAWAGSAGVAQATDGGYDDGGACEELLTVATSGEADADVDPCELPPIDVCELLPYEVSDNETDGIAETSDPCSVEVTLDVVGDCEDPETFVFTINASGLEANTKYTVYLTSDDEETLLETETPNYTEFDFTSDANGDVENATHTATEGDFDFPAGEFTLTYIVVPADFGNGDFYLPYVDQVELSGECTPETQPGTTTPTPTTPAPTTSAPVTAAPVVVTHPAAAQPAVLANTGAPVTAAALLGGGMLVVGAGALVVSRRRAS